MRESADLKIPQGLHRKSGLLLRPANVERGKACDCICPVCAEDGNERPLIAAKGEKMVEHFRHEATGLIQCNFSPERMAHVMAKQVINRIRKIYLPGWRVDSNHRVGGIVGIIGDVKVESPIDNMRPDLMVQITPFDWLMIEIFVSHGVDDVKLHKIKRSGRDCVEIKIPPDADEAEIERLVLSGETTKWLYQRERDYLSWLLYENVMVMDLSTLQRDKDSLISAAQHDIRKISQLEKNVGQLERQIADSAPMISELSIARSELCRVKAQLSEANKNYLTATGAWRATAARRDLAIAERDDALERRKPPEPHTAILDYEQQSAFDEMMYGKDRMLFISGGAGCGKSLLIHRLKHCLGDRVAITAPTAMAAQLIGGCTLHSFLGIKGDSSCMNLEDEYINEKIRSLSVIVIDEVGMCGAKLFTALLERLERAGSQARIIFVGDLMQLGPVKDGWIFENPKFDNVRIKRLNSNYRCGGDPLFMAALNDIRMREDTPLVRSLMDICRVSDLPTDCPGLFAKKEYRDEENNRRLQSMRGDEIVIRRIDDPQYPGADEDLLKGLRCDEALRLKIGAPLVMTRSKYTSPSWINGDIGTLVGINGDTLLVKLARGCVVDVNREDWEVKDGYGECAWISRQHPVSLSYAMTIHKAQGKTFNKVGVRLDGQWTWSLTYVALSRCRTASGLSVIGHLSPQRLYPKDAMLEKCAKWIQRDCGDVFMQRDLEIHKRANSIDLYNHK